ncbi:hypothetical protein ACIAEU_05655 [Enterobacter kobei]|uniref:hypothetical protein n=1 Tax=Enterobacter kobei TaxID=208224 RepID=UPI003D6DAB4D
MTIERMKRPWNVVGAGFNDDGVYFTFDDTTIHRGDVRLMEAAPDLLEALQKLVGINGNRSEPEYVQARAAISKALGEE